MLSFLILNTSTLSFLVLNIVGRAPPPTIVQLVFCVLFSNVIIKFWYPEFLQLLFKQNTTLGRSIKKCCGIKLSNLYRPKQRIV